MNQLAPTISLLDVARGMGRRKLVIIVFTLLALCAGLGIVKVLMGERWEIPVIHEIAERITF